VKCASGSLWIDPSTGFVTAWQAGAQVLAADMDLIVPPDVAAEASAAVCTQSDHVVEAVRTFGPRTLTLRYAGSGDGVSVQAVWRGGVPQDAAIVFHMPGAERWFARAAEGDFESPFRVRHPACDGVVGSIYRLPQGTAVAWDSRLHPFGLSGETSRLGADCAGKRVSFGFDPACFPASVRLLDRIGAAQGLRVAMAWCEDKSGVKIGGDALVFRLASGKAGPFPSRPRPDEEPLAEAAGDGRLKMHTTGLGLAAAAI
jgi:hypothetical protein